MRYVYLINVDAAENINKFYEITENNDKSIDVKYGTVGENEHIHHFTVGERNFDKMVSAKLDRGFIDYTALHSEKTSKESNYGDLKYEPIPDEAINEFIEMLIKSSNDFMKSNYTIEAKDITQKMIDEAENDINNLIDIASDDNNTNEVWRFNESLTELLRDVPRKIDNINDYLAKTSEDFATIIEREYQMLNNIKGQILPAVEIQNNGKSGTVLEAYGLKVKEATYAQEDFLTSKMGYDYRGQKCERRFVRAYVVENERTDRAYEKFCNEHNLTKEDTRLFYHGSKVENWFSIMKSGMMLNPDAKVTGKMFGAGIYFAPELRKSLNYMDTKGSHWNNGQRDTGYTAVFSVALGKCFVPTYEQFKQQFSRRNFNKSNLKDGCLSVYGSAKKIGLENDEYIVYDESQCTIRYLLEMKSNLARDLNYSFPRHDMRNRLIDSLHSLIKTDKGLQTELDLSSLPENTFNIFNDRIVEPYDCDRLFINYNTHSNKISFECITFDGERNIIRPEFTNDDMAFICREMKKAFAEGEKEWRDIVKSSYQIEKGKAVIDKSNHCRSDTERRIVVQNAFKDAIERD